MTDTSGWRKRQIALDQIKDRIELETRPLINFTKQKEWVELTDKEIRALAKPSDDIEIPMTGRMWIFVGDLMTKLKEKNNG